jgi:hypothetical protein
MRQVQENLNAFLDDVVAFLAGNASDEPDATSVVLVRWVVEALCGWGRIPRVETRRHGLRPRDRLPFDSYVLGRALLGYPVAHLPSETSALYFNIACGRAMYNAEF